MILSIRSSHARKQTTKKKKTKYLPRTTKLTRAHTPLSRSTKTTASLINLALLKSSHGATLGTDPFLLCLLVPPLCLQKLVVVIKQTIRSIRSCNPDLALHDHLSQRSPRSAAPPLRPGSSSPPPTVLVCVIPSRPPAVAAATAATSHISHAAAKARCRQHQLRPVLVHEEDDGRCEAEDKNNDPGDVRRVVSVVPPSGLRAGRVRGDVEEVCQRLKIHKGQIRGNGPEFINSLIIIN